MVKSSKLSFITHFSCAIRSNHEKFLFETPTVKSRAKARVARKSGNLLSAMNDVHIFKLGVKVVNQMPDKMANIQ